MLETKKVNNWLCSFQEEFINVIIIVIINRPRTKHNDGGRPIAIGQLTDLIDLKTNKIKKKAANITIHTRIDMHTFNHYKFVWMHGCSWSNW